MAEKTSATTGFCLGVLFLLCCGYVSGSPRNVVVDTDIDTEDIFAIAYLLKQNRSEFNLKAIVINANSWSNAGPAVNLVYDFLYMLGREDVLVGVGGEGGIKADGTIEPDVAGYLPLIEQGESTAGFCRYRQAIPFGAGGMLDIDTNYGLRRELLPQSRKRMYEPGKQATAQQVLLSSLSHGTNTLLALGGHTNIATLFSTHPEVKSHIDHIYVMGGGVRSSNPAGCCAANDTTCVPTSCGARGNLFDAMDTNPNSEFNMFMDPFAAYQVFHSGLPLTLIALDATDTLPLSAIFFSVFEQSTNQQTYEAQYCFQTLKIMRDTWFNDEFFSRIFFWDTFATSVMVSGLKNNHDYAKNEFADIVPTKVTVVTSNKPYAANDGSNPFFAKGRVPPFNIKQGGIHSGHVQTGLDDPYCFSKTPNGRGICEDGLTKETNGSDGVNIFLAYRAKENLDPSSLLNREFYVSFLKVMNDPHQTAAFNFPTEFKNFKEVRYSPKLESKLGKTVAFDMDMTAGDFITLFYLLKTPRTILNLQAITVVGDGWTDASTIDLVYDVLHMMGRDDIAVGRGALFAINQSYPTTFNAEGNCKYRQAIPLGRGGSLDHDTLFGLSRDLPRSPRRYTAHNSVEFGAPRNTEFPERRQHTADEVLSQVFSTGSKITIITGGPLTNVALFLQSNSSYRHKIEALYISGGSLRRKSGKLGNVLTGPRIANSLAEFNFFLDPMAAQYVIESSGDADIFLVPLDASSKTPLTASLVRKFQQLAKTPEAKLVAKLLLRIYDMRRHGNASKFHSRLVLGEVLPTWALVTLSPVTAWEKGRVSVSATGNVSTDGWTHLASSDSSDKRSLSWIDRFDKELFHEGLLAVLNRREQTAVVPSFQDQIKSWS